MRRGDGRGQTLQGLVEVDEIVLRERRDGVPGALVDLEGLAPPLDSGARPE
jgi:hypothetical protein